MSLKTAVSKELSSKMFDQLFRENISRILVLDEFTTQIISKFLKMHDIYDKGITLVDDLNKKREPVPLEAIYFISPRKDKIMLLMNDFHTTPVYVGAHVFFNDECSMENMEMLGRSVAAHYILSLYEIQINFLVNESQLFSFDVKLNLDGYVNDVTAPELARGIVGICEILNENPEIYCQNCEKIQRFSYMVYNELCKKSSENPMLGQSIHKDKSILLILDRSIDLLTPLLHDLHLQCLAYDLLQIDKDVYTYKNHETEKICQVDLSEEDELWRELRHLHFADVSRILPCKLQQLAAAQRSIDVTVNTTETQADLPDIYNDNIENKTETMPNREYVNRQLAYMVKKMPHLRQEVASVNNIFYLSEACLRAFKSGVKDLCDIEQTLVMGTDSRGDFIKNPDKIVVEYLIKSNATMSEKIRIILILIISQAGMSEKKILELVQQLKIDSHIKDIYYGLDRIEKFVWYNNNIPPKIQWSRYPYLNINRKNVVDGSAYTLSRWTPFVKEIIEDLICGKPNTRVISKFDQRTLSLNHLSVEPDGFTLPQRLSWAKSAEQDGHTGPRLIVFILGGVSWAESRVVSNVTKLCQSLRSGQFKNVPNALSEHGGGRGWNWEVLIGGTEILVPETYLQNLGHTE